jgi:hypothetical protein
MKTPGAGLLCSLAWMVSACGSAASYNYDLPEPIETTGPTLATLRGQTIGAPFTADPDRYRVALAWFPVSPAEGKVQSIQNPSYHLGWNYFEIEISGEPPSHAVEGEGMMRYAQAEVVFYEDLNGNKKLDLVTRAQAPVDRVIGRANGARVWWLGAGSNPASAENRGVKPVAPGWSFTYGPIKAEPQASDCSPSPEQGTYRPVCSSRIKEPAQDLSPEYPLIITVTDDPKLQSYACSGFWGTSKDKSDEWSDTTPGWNSPEVRRKICNPETCDRQGAASPLDLPVAGRNVQIQCNLKQTIYTWKDCEPDPKLCGTVFCHVGRGARDPEQDPPPSWPTCSN